MNDAYAFYGLTAPPFAQVDVAGIVPLACRTSLIDEILAEVGGDRTITTLGGEAGVGKSTLLLQLSGALRQAGHAVVPIGRAAMPTEIQSAIDAALGTQMVAAVGPYQLIKALEGRGSIVLLFDDADALPEEALQFCWLLLRLLDFRTTPLHLVLVGSLGRWPALESPELVELRQRAGWRAVMRPLTDEEAATYLAERLARAGQPARRVFSRSAQVELLEQAFGLPGQIDAMGDAALAHGYRLQRRPIGRRMLMDALSLDGSLYGDMFAPEPRSGRPGWRDIATGLAMVAGVAVLTTGMLRYEFQEPGGAPGRGDGVARSRPIEQEHAPDTDSLALHRDDAEAGRFASLEPGFGEAAPSVDHAAEALAELGGVGPDGSATTTVPPFDALAGSTETGSGSREAGVGGQDAARPPYEQGLAEQGAAGGANAPAGALPATGVSLPPGVADPERLAGALPGGGAAPTSGEARAMPGRDAQALSNPSASVPPGLGALAAGGPPLAASQSASEGGSSPLVRDAPYPAAGAVSSAAHPPVGIASVPPGPLGPEATGASLAPAPPSAAAPSGVRARDGRRGTLAARTKLLPTPSTTAAPSLAQAAPAAALPTAPAASPPAVASTPPGHDAPGAAGAMPSAIASPPSAIPSGSLGHDVLVAEGVIPAAPASSPSAVASASRGPNAPVAAEAIPATSADPASTVAAASPSQGTPDAAATTLAPPTSLPAAVASTTPSQDPPGMAGATPSAAASSPSAVASRAQEQDTPGVAAAMPAAPANGPSAVASALPAQDTPGVTGAMPAAPANSPPAVASTSPAQDTSGMADATPAAPASQPFTLTSTSPTHDEPSAETAMPAAPAGPPSAVASAAPAHSQPAAGATPEAPAGASSAIASALPAQDPSGVGTTALQPLGSPSAVASAAPGQVDPGAPEAPQDVPLAPPTPPEAVASLPRAHDEPSAPSAAMASRAPEKPGAPDATEPPASRSASAKPDSAPQTAGPGKAVAKRRGGPGLALLAQSGDTVQALYARVYQGLTPPPYEDVVAINHTPLRPGAIVVFPEPPGGWTRR